MINFPSRLLAVRPARPLSSFRLVASVAVLAALLSACGMDGSGGPLGEAGARRGGSDSASRVTETPAARPGSQTPSTGITTGTVSLSWTPPAENIDGSTLGNLAGYRVYYGSSPDSLTTKVDISNPGLSAYVIENLSAGTTYFAVTAYNHTGNESPLSGVGSKTIS